MADVKWVKLKIDMFDDEKVKIIQAMPEGDSILVVWIRLIALAGKCNAGGLVMLGDGLPFTDEMLAVVFGKPLATVRLALRTLEGLRMVENTEEGIYITNFGRHQNAEGMDRIREQNRIRKQRERERKAALALGQAASGGQGGQDTGPSASAAGMPAAAGGVTPPDVPGASRDGSREVTQQREDKDKEKEEEEKDDRISPGGDIAGGGAGTGGRHQGARRARLEYGAIMEDYNRTCVDLPMLQAVSPARRRAVRSLIDELERLEVMEGAGPHEKLHQVFRMAQDSSFLSGRDGKWGGCSFDWLVKKPNALKVLEGNYADDRGNHTRRGDTGDARAGGQPGTADGREIESTTLEALELLRRNGGGL